MLFLKTAFIDKRKEICVYYKCRKNKGLTGNLTMKTNNKTLTKINDFYGKYKLFIGLGIISVLLFACPFVEKMWLAVSVLLGLFMLTFSVNEIFTTMLFMTPFSGLDSLYVITIIIALVVIFIKYVIEVVKKQKKVYLFPLITTLLIIALSTIKSFVVGERNIETGMLLVFVFALCYFVLVYRKEISVSKCFNALLCGLFVSVGITLVLSRFEEFKYFIRSFEGYYMRLKMTTFHMNNLALLCIFELAYSIHSILNRTRKIWIDIVAVILSTALGVLTLSKVFLVMLALFVLYFMIALVVKLKKKSIKYLLIFAGLVVVLCIAGKSYILDIYDRLFLYNNGGSFWNEILNGRVDIWNIYLKDFKSSWHNILFGVGLFRPNLSLDPHNAYIFVLHRFGVVGIAFILVLICAYIKSAKPEFKFSFCKILLVLTWFVIGLEEVVLSDQFAIYLIFGLMLLFESKKQNKVVFVTEEVKTEQKEIIEEKDEAKTKEPKIEKPKQEKKNNKKVAEQNEQNQPANRFKPKSKVKVKYNQLSNK